MPQEAHQLPQLVGKHSMVLRGRQAQSPSPSPTQPKKHVTFWDQGGETLSEEDPSRELLGQVTGEELEEYNLGSLPILKPELESFLEAPTPMHRMLGIGVTCSHWSPQ